VETGKRLDNFDDLYPEEFASSGAVSPDNEHLVVTGTHGRLCVCRAHQDASGSHGLPGWSGPLKVIRAHEGWVLSAGYSPDGSTIVSASADRTLKLWDWNSERGDLVTLEGHDQAVHLCGFSPDGTKVLSASSDATARVWDRTHGTELCSFWAASGVGPAVWSPDGRRLAVGTHAGSIELLRLENVEVGPPVVGGWHHPSTRGLFRCLRRTKPMPSVARSVAPGRRSGPVVLKSPAQAAERS
jgi:WD40 repeat protein